MWIETQNNSLVNLDNLSSITTRVIRDHVDVVGREGDNNILIASLKSQDHAMKFFKRLIKESEAGKKCVSSDAIIISIENEK